MKSFKSLLLRHYQFSLFIAFGIILINCESKVKVSDEPALSDKVIYESREREDLLEEYSPDGLRVVQITTNPNIRSHHVYTEAQVFTPDSRKFVFWRSRADAPAQSDVWLCDIEDNFGLRQITYEDDAMNRPITSLDGKWVYYCVSDKTQSPEGSIILKRVSLNNYKRETILMIDGPIPGTNYRPTHFSLRAISSDCKRLCAQAFLGDGKTENAPFGILIFDIEDTSVKLLENPLFKGQHFNNMHLQYCPSTDPLLSHDILIQHNHSSIIDVNGRTIKLVGGAGADIHVIRDDGTNWRDVPLGRDGILRCQGHQQWFGKNGQVISNMSGKNRAPIFIALPIPTDETTSHKGNKIPGGKYADITRNIDKPDFWHLSPDISGMHIVSDTHTIDKKTDKRSIRIAIGTLSPGEKPELKAQYLLNTKTSGKGQAAHPHPFFSPDASMTFFNSDVDGIPQIFMVTEYKFPEF